MNDLDRRGLLKTWPSFASRLLSVRSTSLTRSSKDFTSNQTIGQGVLLLVEPL